MAILKQQLTLREKTSRWLAHTLKNPVDRFVTSKYGFLILIIGLPIFLMSLAGWFFTTRVGLAILGTWDFFAVLVACLFIAAVLFSVYIAVHLSVTRKWWTLRAWLTMCWAQFLDRRKSITTDMRVVRARYRHMNSASGTVLTIAAYDAIMREPETKIVYDKDRHVLTIGGTGAGKGVACIIQNLLHHLGSVICFDPSGENFLKTAAFRQKILGSQVILIDPFGVTGEPSHTWNPLFEIDFHNDTRAMDKCFMLAESLIEQMGGNSFFTKSAQELLAMLCAYIGLRTLPENMHLPHVHELIGGGELEGLWFSMSNCEGMNGMVKRFAQACLERDKEEFGSVIQTLRTALRFLMSESMRTNLESSSFSMKDLKRKNVSLYIVVPAGAGETYKGWLRLLFDFAFEAAQDTSIPNPEHSTLFMIDELPLLKLERIKRAAGEARKFGVRLFLCAQDIPQLTETFGNAWETFVGNSGLTIFFGNNDLTTQKYLSEKLGKEYYDKVTRTGPTSITVGPGGASATKSTTQELRSVARTDELEKMTSREAGKAFFLIAGHKPMCLPLAKYYEWDLIPEGLTYDPELSSPTNKASNDDSTPDGEE